MPVCSEGALLPNISAGVVVGVVALPLAMAFAIASGAKPEQGLYTALVAGLMVTLFGGTRVQIAGPTGAFAVLLFGVTASTDSRACRSSPCSQARCCCVFGLAKLGRVIRFIPESVVLGFTAGIAVVIWVGQWGNFFGLPAVEARTLVEKLRAAGGVPHLHPVTTLLGVASLLIVALWPSIPVARRDSRADGRTRRRDCVRHRSLIPTALPPSARRSAASRAGCRR